ncbi:MAG: hypothetical protein K0U47_03005 [Epsilonproteobacteria bacterium]|nr:hypothetical protein [Campylobacterota bacterium]
MSINKFLQIVFSTLLLSSVIYINNINADTQVSTQATLTFEERLNKPKKILSNSDTFTFDNLINFTVSTVGTEAIKTTPGAKQVILKFKVTNNGNHIQDFTLRAIQSPWINSTHKQHFSAENIMIYVDKDNNNIYTPSIDTLSYIDELGINQSVTIFLVADMPKKGLQSDHVAYYDLEASVAKGGKAGHLGEIITKDDSDIVDHAQQKQIVFSDNAGSFENDLQHDGKHSSRHGYLIYLSSMMMSQTSYVIQDPLNNTNNPKRIPGAIIRHCYSIKNQGNKDSFIANINDMIDLKMFNIATLTNENIRIYSDQKNFDCHTAHTLSTKANKGTINTQTGKIKIIFNGVAAKSMKSAYFDLQLH